MPGGASTEYDDLRYRDSIKPFNVVNNWTAQNKHNIEANDMQQGNYANGQITFNLSTLVSSKSFNDFAGSDLNIPIEMSAAISRTGGGANNMRFPAANQAQFAQLNRHFMSIQNNHGSLINGLTVECNGKQVIPFQQLSNIPATYKIMKEWTETDQDQMGPSVGFRKDTSGSSYWDPRIGEVNNTVSGVVMNTADPGGGAPAHVPAPVDNPVNTARVTRIRQKYQVVDPNNQTTANLRANRRPVFRISPDGLTMTWTEMVKIPLRYIHSLFENLPLNRSGLWTMTFYTNLPASHSIAYTMVDPEPLVLNEGAVNNCSVRVAGVTAQLLNQFSPYTVSPVCIRSDATAPTNQTAWFNGCVVSCVDNGVARNNFTITTSIKAGNDYMASSYLGINQIQLSPDKEAELLRNPTQTVLYDDWIFTRPAGADSLTTQVSRLVLSSAQAKLRGVLVHFSVPRGYNGTVMGNVDSLASP